MCKYATMESIKSHISNLTSLFYFTKFKLSHEQSSLCHVSFNLQPPFLHHRQHNLKKLLQNYFNLLQTENSRATRPIDHILQRFLKAFLNIQMCSTYFLCPIRALQNILQTSLKERWSSIYTSLFDTDLILPLNSVAQFSRSLNDVRLCLYVKPLWMGLLSINANCPRLVM